MIDTHPIMIPCPDDTVVWRYMDFCKYKSLLETRCLFFCRADRFADPFEGSIPKLEYDFRFEEQQQAEQFFGWSHDPEHIKKHIEDKANVHRQDKIFTVVNCWHINNLENDAMWKLYLKDNEGVAIRTTKKRLEKSLVDAMEPILISKIRYIDYLTDYWFDKDKFPHRGYNFFTPLIHKRKEFSHEQELRLFYQVPFDHQLREAFWEKQKTDKGLFMKTNVEELIEGVYFAPTANEHIKLEIILQTEALGYQFKYCDSKLQETPYY